MPDADGAKRWVAEVFDRAAPTYDRVGDSYHDHFGARLVEVAAIPPGADVLDVACGRGAVLLPAVARAGPSGRVIGIDISAEMVREAQAALARVDATNAEAVVMDAEHLDFDDSSFHFVLCSFGIFFFPDPERAVAEFGRVLRPGGVVALSSWTDEDERWAWEDDLLADVRVARRAIVRPFDAPDDLGQLLSGAGLIDVRLHPEQHQISFSTADEWWEWMWSYSVRGLLEQMADRERDAFKQAAFSHLQAQRQPDGFPMQLTACFALGRTTE